MTTMTLSECWSLLTATFMPQKTNQQQFTEHPDSQKFKDKVIQAQEVMDREGMGNLMEDWFLENLKQYLQQVLAPDFWKWFLEQSENQSGDRHHILAVSIEQQLCDKLLPYMECVARFEEFYGNRSGGGGDATRLFTTREQFHIAVKAAVFTSHPSHFIKFVELVDGFYSRSFKAFHKLNHQDEEIQDRELSYDDDTCLGCAESIPECRCPQILARFHKLNSQLHDLGLLERVAGDTVIVITQKHIEQHIKHTCKADFETPFLASLENWLKTSTIGWVNVVFRGPLGERQLSPATQAALSKWKDWLHHYLCETYANLRIDELFDIIVDFPDSLPCLKDLYGCLEKTDQRSHLVTSLMKTFDTRLLHPGASTKAILKQYMLAIRALRILDSSGVILDVVCEPIRKYLRTREDTVRCIVSDLIQDSNSELAGELVRGNPVSMDENSDSDSEDWNWEKWQPPPVYPDPVKVTKRRKTLDIISMLVNIYGTRDMFIKEYRDLLADRLLSAYSYNTEREIRHLELLKLKFGEADLQACEVMLKDISDSRRINAHIAETEGLHREIQLNSMILSGHFWPAFREESLVLPEAIQRAAESYKQQYQQLKGMRTLCWEPHLGQVDLEVQLKDRTLSLSSVSPLHATIIMHFQDKEAWSLEELSSLMQVPATALRRKMAFWQTKGVLKEEPNNVFVLAEERPGGQAVHHDVMMIDNEEKESAMASARDQREEELQVFWSYIVGMLTNLESLPLGRIHSMLKMFAMQGPSATEYSAQELRLFLDRKVKEQKLVFSAGVYRLPPK